MATSNASWKNEEDFENDLDALSDGHAYSHLPKPAPSPSKYMIKLRGKPSIFEEDSFVEDFEEKPCLPVRGYPIKKPELKPPGGVPSFLNGEIPALIREVSGLGYSNDLIEHMVKGNTNPPLKKLPDVPDLAFHVSNSSANRHMFKVDNSRHESGSRGPSPIIMPRKQTTSPTCKIENMKENRFNIRNQKEFPELR